MTAVFRRLPACFGVGAWLHGGTALASYGQMKLSFGAFAAIPGALLALLPALLELIASNLVWLRIYGGLAGLIMLLVGVLDSGSLLAVAGGSLLVALLAATIERRASACC